jgi:VanZ family protein
VYLIVLLNLRQVEERVHFLEYGLVGGLVYSALRERRRNRLEAAEPLGPATRFAGPVAIVVNGLAGWSDEGIQALLPQRVYELHDVAMNVLAGTLAISAMAARGWAARQDQARR